MAKITIPIMATMPNRMYFPASGGGVLLISRGAIQNQIVSCDLQK